MVGVKSWTEICKDRLANNFAALRQIVEEESLRGSTLKEAAPTALLGVIKADAYGHGIDPCAAVLAGAGAEWLGVTDAAEGAAVCDVLATAGIVDRSRPEILVMCGTMSLQGEAELVVRHGLVPVVWSKTHLARLVKASEDAGCTSRVNVHLEIDTGMSRQGVKPGEELGGVLAQIKQEPRLWLHGVLTHFASTEVAHSEQTAAQQEQIMAALEQVVAAGMKPAWVHVGNSSYIDNESGNHPLGWLRSIAGRMGARSMVRSGLALYGYLLPISGKGRALAAAHVLPVLTWKTRVIAVAEVPAGAAVGYNGSFVAKSPTRLALLPVGYADGYRRELSSSTDGTGGWVILRGQRADVAGRVSMNLLTVDVSAIEGVQEGEEAVLLGDGMTADDHAQIAGTIAYEILCGIRASSRDGRS